MEEVKEAFQLFDSNKSGQRRPPSPLAHRLHLLSVAELTPPSAAFSGSIDLRELKAAMRALGLDVSKEEMKVALAQLNKDPSSASAASLSITLDDFLSLMSTRMPARDSREEVEKVFRLFDEDGSGFITFRSLKKICNDLGEGLTEEEMQEMIDEADRDQDGKISFEEFFRIMKKRSHTNTHTYTHTPTHAPPASQATTILIVSWPPHPSLLCAEETIHSTIGIAVRHSSHPTSSAMR